MRNLFRYFLSLLSFYIKNDTSKFNNNSLIINNEIIEKLKKIKKIIKLRKKTHTIFNKDIIHLINERKLINFLRSSFIQKMFFIHNRLFIKNELNEIKNDKKFFIQWKYLLKEDEVGDPIRYFLYPESSGNRIRQVYHLKKFSDFSNINIKTIKRVIEIGGGYGCMARIFSKLNHKIKYIIFDTFEVNLLQYYFLKLNKLEVAIENSKSRINLISSIKINNEINYKNNSKTLLIANWSLSEMPLKLRNKILKLIFKIPYILISFQDKFEDINNLKYFKKIKITREKLGFKFGEFVFTRAAYKKKIIKKPKKTPKKK
jgi:ribosomal protein S19